MRTYITSLRPGSRLAHIGNSYWTACGFIPLSYFKVFDAVPADREVCVRCAKRYVPVPLTVKQLARQQRLAERAAQQEQRQDELERVILDQFRAGREQEEIARSLRIGVRTMVRHVRRMRCRVGARTKFQWGYFVGLNEGRAGK